MADTSTTALNIGSQRVAMATFSGKGGKLTLTKYGSAAILADPVLDATRMPKVQNAIQSLASDLKVGKSTIRYSLSGQPVITRFLKLPPLDGEDVDQLVRFEAQQVIPVPLEETSYSYKVMESSGLDQEVALFAIKSEQLDEIHDAVEGAGLQSSEIDVAPAAIYNAFRYNYGEVTEPTLIVDIGARSTNLIFAEGNRFFARTASVGGASVTAAIAKNYNISFSDAENQKLQNGLIALGGGHTSQLDEETAGLAMVVRNAFAKLPAEISRTTSLYRSQHGGGAPARVLIAGGGANLAYTKEFFEEKLNLPVEVFNPLQRVKVAGSVDAAQVQADAHLMGELVGLAIRPLGKAAVSIDLVPTNVEFKRANDKRKPILLAAAAIFLAALGAWAFFKQADATEAAERAAAAKAVTDTSQAPAQKIRALFREEDQLNNRTNALAAAEQGRARWLDILNIVTENATSPFYWTTDFVPLIGYAPLDPNRRAQPAVSDGFAKAKPGESILPRLGAGRSPEINAIQINGFWRENPDDNRVIFEIISRLKENGGEYFAFEVQQQGKKVELAEDTLIRNVAVKDDDSYAWPFEIIIPLKETITY